MDYADLKSLELLSLELWSETGKLDLANRGVLLKMLVSCQPWKSRDFTPLNIHISHVLKYRRFGTTNPVFPFGYYRLQPNCCCSFAESTGWERFATGSNPPCSLLDTKGGSLLPLLEHCAHIGTWLFSVISR